MMFGIFGMNKLEYSYNEDWNKQRGLSANILNTRTILIQL